MPATVGALRRSLAEAARAQPTLRPSTQLDLGTGTGGALLAARSLWPGLHRQVGVDRSAPMLEVAASALEPHGTGGALGAQELPGAPGWADSTCRVDLQAGMIGEQLEQRARDAETFDLVTAAYSIGELAGVGVQDRAIELAWAITASVLVVVEAGTPAGFARVHRWRERLVGLGALVVAPCPHQLDCPIAAASGEWCHFSVRVDRSALLREAKGATLGYEDEKFSYLVAVRPRPLPGSVTHNPTWHRVLRHPWHAPRRTELTLCTAGGTLEHVTVRKGDAAYKAASKLRWGDRFGDDREVSDPAISRTGPAAPG